MTGPAARAARALFVAHVGLIVFSTVAMLTVLAGAPGPRLAGEPAATVMRLAFRFAGPTYVVLGGLATLALLGSRIGWKRAATLTALIILISSGAELLGTSTGLPFGDYTYSDLLGPRVFGRVPFPIPVSWFYMVVGALAIVARVRPADDDRMTPWTWAVLAGLLLVAWDLSMDPAMVSTAHWRWGPGSMFRHASTPSWVTAFFTADVWYGMPLSNWVGWLLTGSIVARVALVVVPPAAFRDGVAPATLPVLLYLVNGVMPVALCFRDGFWRAAGAGAVAMLIPAALALGRPSGPLPALHRHPA